jgi:hypothetical protein
MAEGLTSSQSTSFVIRLAISAQQLIICSINFTYSKENPVDALKNLRKLKPIQMNPGSSDSEENQPGGHGSSSRSNGFPALCNLIASSYCCTLNQQIVQ